MTSLFKEFNELDENKKITLLTSCFKPAIGGWLGDIWVDDRGRCFANLRRPNEPEIIAIVPNRFIELARNANAEYNPYDDAAYAHRTIELAQLAIANAEQWQKGRGKPIIGKCHLFDRELFEVEHYSR